MEGERESRIMGVQMNHLRGLLGIMRMYKVPNVQIRHLWGVMKCVDEKFDEGQVERMENDKIAKRVYLVECLKSLTA